MKDLKEKAEYALDVLNDVSAELEELVMDEHAQKLLERLDKVIDWVYNLTKEKKMNTQNLEDVLEEISIKNLENFDESKFIDLIKEKMPGWEITVWDADETDNGYKDGLVGAVADCIIDEIKEERTKIQHGHWTTNCGDLYYYVVASKKA